jgi:transposase
MMPPFLTADKLACLSAEAQEIIRALVAYYEARLARWEAENAALREELATLKKTPQNSSLPPSTQHPHARPPRPSSKTQRKQGGQPGHAKHARPLLPTDQCQTVQVARPTACRRCGRPLAGDDPAPLRQQIWEVPALQPHVTEYQQHRLRCVCGVTTCAALPAGVPASQAGPRLVALVALLLSCFRQSKQRVTLFLEQVLGQPCSPGWVVKLQQQATAALQPAYTQLVAQLPTQPRLNIDETPTKEGHRPAWLWTFVATSFTVFAQRTTRAATVLGELLTPAYQGVVTCDRAKMYWWLPQLQWCWAHLKRDFQALVDSGNGQAQHLGHALLKPTQELFRLGKRVRDGTLTHVGMKRQMKPLRQQMDRLLLRGIFSGNPRLYGMCRELYTHRERLWTFLAHPGLAPTNNASERALRHAVIWRKLSFGTQSEHGSRFVETLLTVIETCRQQGKKVWAFLTQALEAYYAKKTPPSLLVGV